MSLYAWGKNNYGQLGVKREPAPSSSSRHQPRQGHQEEEQQVQPAEARCPPKLGSERAGQGQEPVGVEVDGESFVAAAAGEHHTLVVTQYGDVLTFGRGKEGQLGHGEASRLDMADSPRKVESLSNVTATGVACGAFHSLAVTSSGALYEWGLIHTDPDWTAEKEATDADLLALAGPSQGHVNPAHRLSSVVADSARRWLSATDDTENSERDDSSSAEDNNSMDEETRIMQKRMLERLPTRSRQPVPRLATSLRGLRVTSISAGYAHSVAVTDQGRAFSSGQNDRGQILQLGLAHRIHSGIFREVVGMAGRFFLELGLEAASTKLAPTHNPLLSDVGGGVVSVSAGANHSVCAMASGLVMSWGASEYCQQGCAVVAGADLMRHTSSSGGGYFRVPRAVNGLVGTHIVSVHCGSNFTLAVDRNGLTHSFGWNEGDALGRGWEGGYDPAPGRIPSIPRVVSVAAGSRHGVAVTAEGPAVGRHLRPLIGAADSADVELVTPDATSRGEPGVPAHMSVISARCPYLMGHIEAARKSTSASAAADTNENGADNDGDASKRVVLCLEHASAETVPLLARYLYADELPSDATSGKTLEALARLANELLLPRLEGLSVQKLPYYLRRRYVLRTPNTTLPVSGAFDVPQSTFVNDLGRLAGWSNRSDMLLVLPAWGWEFPCHRAVLCASPWWHALLEGGFREGGGDKVDLSGLLLEGVTRTEALEVAIRHVYSNSRFSVVDLDPEVVMEVVIIAEFMVLSSLTSACQCELGRYVDEDNAPQLARFANRYRLLKLETRCQELLLSSSSSTTTTTMTTQ
ncbi:conserved unknown protein [Ectocarpus siliculosus]|uniref:BTB domain-containing protein n=1 Tax=Ectocarpus siliculosus TaxID=2880 RepID=D8LSA5_ECTSI|nr:conserved unknown protein [Ectocarpus siliculosus]|eukprot:CBN75162.1 conserved unknown protein [Ectocarpus siliculosus]